MRRVGLSWATFLLALGQVQPFVSKTNSFPWTKRNTLKRGEDLGKQPIDYEAKRLASPSIRTVCRLVPLSRFRQELTIFDNAVGGGFCFDDDGFLVQDIRNDGENNYEKESKSYQLCLVEEDDLPDLSRFIVSVFGADAVRLSQNVTAFERMMMQPAVELANSYSGIIAYAEVLAGIRSRLESRCHISSREEGVSLNIDIPRLEGLSPTEQVDLAAKSSIILALAKRIPDSDWRIDVVASVELRMERNDAKIPFSLPWLDKMERKLASFIKKTRESGSSDGSSSFRPYLSNLCVAEEFQGRGIGRALVRVVEDIVKTKWEMEDIYLHVDEDNKAALSLYISEGYRDSNRRWKTPWTGKASDIGHYVHRL